MMRAAIAIVMITAGAAAARPAKPERVHRADIPAGTEWWCYSVPSAGLSSCSRSEEQCHQVQSRMSEVMQAMQERGRGAGVPADEMPSMDDATSCTLTSAVWVRTGMEGTEWRHLVAPSKEACENAPAWGMGMYQHESGCERWHETEAPPDAAIVPAGKGWSCYAAGATTICARTKDWCAVAYRMSHGDGSAPACKPAKRAYVFTSGGAFHAFGDDAACEAARDDDGAASTCAAE